MLDLLNRYPGLAVDFVVREQFGDLIEDRLDLAMRLGQPTDASLVARSVGEFGRALVAAPSYLEKHGAPSDPAALPSHRCIVQDADPSGATWRFSGPGGPHSVDVVSTFSANNAEVVRQAALAGHGIALLPEPQVLEDILGARLYRLLPEYPTDADQSLPGLPVPPASGAAHAGRDRLPGRAFRRRWRPPRRRARVGRARNRLAGLRPVSIAHKCCPPKPD